MKELWKDVEGYEGMYQVSSFGRVRSLNRFVSSGNFWKGRFLKLCINSKKVPYLQVSLSKSNIRKQFHVHRLVAKAFIPNLKNQKYTHHKDHNPINNMISNLVWCSNSDNAKEAYKAGRIIPWHKGTKGLYHGPWHNRKLTFTVWNKGKKMSQAYCDNVRLSLRRAKEKRIKHYEGSSNGRG